MELSLSLNYHVLLQYLLYLVYLLVTMPLLRSRVLSLHTLTLRKVARNLNLFWKEEWDPELQKVTEASDDILLNLRKNYHK